ncbi:MAG: type II secretion system protein N [Methylovulum sp.]|nr:type II secretion system protein N [Methylovulum sp.]
MATGLALAYLLVISIPALTPTSTETGKATSQSAIVGSPAAQEPQDFSLTSDFHLFGLSTATASANGYAPLESTQPITLIGIFYVTGQQAHAVIETSDHRQKAYKINDTLPGGAVLHAIASDKILLRGHDQQELMLLQKTQTETTKPQTANKEQAAPEPASEIIIQPPESLAN